MSEAEHQRVVVDSRAWPWRGGDGAGRTRLVLHAAAGLTTELVTMERLEPAAGLAGGESVGGEEIFVLSGALADEHGTYDAGNMDPQSAGLSTAFEGRARGGVLKKAGTPGTTDREHG